MALGLGLAPFTLSIDLKPGDVVLGLEDPLEELYTNFSVPMRAIP
jgi:hypothetical protein